MVSRTTPGLALKYLPANDAWIWMFRGTWLTLKGEGRFFQTKKEARAAARRLGMKL